MARVLVTDGDQRSSLAVVRSLGRAGHHIQVSGPGSSFLAGRSRFCQESFSVPSVLEAQERFLEVISETATRERIDIILPMTEPTLLAMAEHREAFGEVKIPVPDLPVLSKALDKAAIMEAARGVGFGVPRQLLWESPDTLPAQDISFPVVIKPSRSVVGEGADRRKLGVTYASDREEFSRITSDLPPGAWPILLQERIVGPGIGLFFLIWEGQVLGRFAHRRIREKPPSGGVSVLRESTLVPEEWYEKGAALLRNLGWFGVAMVELKQDQSSGKPYMMEVNPRFWGSLQLAIDAGMDFPKLLVDAAMGEHAKAVLDYTEGVKTRWVMGDVDHLLMMFLKKRGSLNLPPGAPGRSRTLMDFIKAFHPSIRGEVFRWSDPGPALFEAIRWFRFS